MSLRIVLHDPRVVYTAGAPVNGTVFLTGTYDVDVGQISITFSGRCKSKLVVSRGNNGSDYYRGRVPLFHFEQVLFQGPRTLHPNQHSWDFTFSFPTNCISSGGDRFHYSSAIHRGFGPAYNFNDDLNQPLPASFILAEQGWTRRASGFISYELEAILRSDGSKVFGSSGFQAVKPLFFRSTRNVAEPNAELFSRTTPFECQSMHLVPGYEDRKLTFKEKMSSLRSKNLPTSKFRLVLSMPKVCILGQALPLYLGVDHDIENSTAEAPPITYLKYIKVAIENIGKICCVNNHVFSWSSDDKIEPWSESTIVREWGGDMQKLPLTERMDLREFLRLTVQPRLFSTTFSTFNLEVHHALKVRVTVECAKKDFKAGWYSNELAILPERYRPPEILDSAVVLHPAVEERYDMPPREEDYIAPPQYAKAAQASSHAAHPGTSSSNGSGFIGSAGEGGGGAS